MLTIVLNKQRPTLRTGTGNPFQLNMIQSTPISVVMPVYNAAPYLDRSIKSILDQTFENFEFIIGDDGSTDESRELLADWARKDSRIKLYRSDRNQGPVGSSNWVVSKASSPLIARMDADDEACSDRLQRQFEVLQRHPEIGLVGSLAESIDGDGKVLLPGDRSLVLSRSFFAPFSHGSILLRRSLFDQLGGYREACVFWEDLDLYLRCARVTKVAVIARVLYRFRYALTSTRVTSAQVDVEAAIDLMLRCVAEVEQGRRYEALLSPKARRRPGEKLIATTYQSIGFGRIWRRLPSGVLGSMLRRAALAPDRASARALLWALWADLSPGSLRSYIGFRLRERDSAASHQVVDGEIYDWPIGGLPLSANGEVGQPDSRAVGSE